MHLTGRTILLPGGSSGAQGTTSVSPPRSRRDSQTSKKWYADFRFQHANGTVERVRKRSPIQSKAGADEFEHQLRTELLAPARSPTKEVPTFSAYATEFMETYVIANNKPSERSMKATEFGS